MVRKLLRVFLKRLPREGFWHTFFEFGQWVWDHPLATACCSGVATMIWDWAGWDAVERVVAGLAVGLLHLWHIEVSAAAYRWRRARGHEKNQENEPMACRANLQPLHAAGH